MSEPSFHKDRGEEHRHDFSDGPNCSTCGLHASVVEGGALSPAAITKRLAEGDSVSIPNPAPQTKIGEAGEERWTIWNPGHYEESHVYGPAFIQDGIEVVRASRLEAAEQERDEWEVNARAAIQAETKLRHDAEAEAAKLRSFIAADPQSVWYLRRIEDQETRAEDAELRVKELTAESVHRGWLLKRVRLCLDYGDPFPSGLVEELALALDEPSALSQPTNPGSEEGDG